MEIIYLGIVIFLFILAIFDLWVGVSNDAVNFLNSAIGAKAASFKVIIAIAAIGVFCGAIMSNGMMEVARHGIFHPQYFSFAEIMCILMAVMVSDILLLDAFNSLGLPTSTTVSLVFELLGATIAIALFKSLSPQSTVQLAEMINTDKAFSVIIAIFVSVPIAFIFGSLVQWITRLLFTFDYKKNLNRFVGIFGGLAATAIVYFMLIKGTKDLVFMTDVNKLWIAQNTGKIVLFCFIGFSLIMELLHLLKINVFKVIVLLGTFSLAMAFAGNDLVNFIGVPLAGYSAYQDYIANSNGLGVDSFLMDSLNSSASTPWVFLVGAGTIMIMALMYSKKAKNVIKTSLNLSKQKDDDELFGTSPIARKLVRSTTSIASGISKYTPESVTKWVDKRFNKDEAILATGASFDLVRASVNLVIAGLLVALGTSLKLPLSTTYVTFMVAMGTSLADRAWGRESAVFRITGVISVIGGWFITAGAALLLSIIIATIMHLGGIIAMIIAVIVSIILIIKSESVYKNRRSAEPEDVVFENMMSSKSKDQVWDLLKLYLKQSTLSELLFIKDTFANITDSFANEDLKSLRRAVSRSEARRVFFKKTRRKQILGFSKVDPSKAITHNTWFHTISNNIAQLHYCLKRMYEPCLEHIDNNFVPLPKECSQEFRPFKERINETFEVVYEAIQDGNALSSNQIINLIDALRMDLTQLMNNHALRIQKLENKNLLNIYMVYLNILQESQQMCTSVKHLCQAYDKFMC